MRERLLRVLGRIGVRLLVVNLLVLLVPVAGLEFARIHERQLLLSLERDMRDQAVIVRALCEADLGAGVAIADRRHAAILTEAARRTRTRVRLLDAAGAVVADSHENGPPEGPEPPPPHVLPRAHSEWEVPIRDLARDPNDPNNWPEIEARSEVRAALAGNPGSYARMRERAPASSSSSASRSAPREPSSASSTPCARRGRCWSSSTASDRAWCACSASPSCSPP